MGSIGKKAMEMGSTEHQQADFGVEKTTEEAEKTKI